MKLSEKIYYCRKKAGKSQEALAEQLGVSRQAISKWETGDAEPEIGKLRLLADAFGVSTDWLLSEEEPEEETSRQQEPPSQPPKSTNWVESVPGVLGRLLRRYGWLFGVYIALSGCGLAVIGALARILTRRMFSSFDDMTGGMFNDFGGGFPGGTIYYDGLGEFSSQASDSISSFAANNPVSMLGSAMLVIGIILIIAGVILAIVLKKRSKD